ncbi:MAG: ATP phosphoribosyltransferase regulatory subunit, partial [Parvularculaceae bacterium]|nr:ATP phosphoribosyltransferase regulatory subunit [Parvularculaceae bacterium]
EALEAAGLLADDFQIRINDRNVLSGLLETIGLVGDEHSDKRLGALRAMDKLERLGEAGVRALLGPGRKDMSGDFAEGANLSDRDIDRVMAFMAATAPTNAETCARLANVIGGTAAGAKGVETLAEIASQLKKLGVGDSRAKVDLSVIRGLEYYTGPVFEAELVREIKEDGRPVRFGSIASGGRYDGLVERFKGVEVPAVGVSVGVSRLLAILEVLERGGSRGEGPVVVLALESDQMADYQLMAAELRGAGVRAEVYVGGSGMKAQMKYADKRAAPLVVIVGGDERARGEVTIKDMRLGAELAKKIEDNVEWREGQKAQASVPRHKLVEEVKRTLARG